MAFFKTDVTVYIGRFNPLHLGHCHVLKQALLSSKLVIVLVGSAGLSRSLKNPFSFAERSSMLYDWYAELDDKRLGSMVVVAARDYPYNNTLWCRNIQNLVKRTINSFELFDFGPNPRIKLTGSDRDETTWYLQSFPQWEQALIEPYRQDGITDVSATKIRNWLFNNGAPGTFVANMMPPTTLDFINRFEQTDEYEQLNRLYEFVENYKARAKAYPHPPIYHTVDAVVVQSGHILTVVRGRHPGKGLWALPGGFVNQEERLRDAAIRELIEETNIQVAVIPPPKNPTPATAAAHKKRVWDMTAKILGGSIRSYEAFDKPDRSDRGRTITNAYFFRLDDMKPLPEVSGVDQGNNDPECDVSTCLWLPIDEALERSDMWFEDHHALVEWGANLVTNEGH